MRIYVLLNDKSKGSPKTYYKYDKELFTKENLGVWGVYFTPNEFDATDEELLELQKKNKQKTLPTKRNKCFLKKLSACFADLDVAKEGDGKMQDEKQIIKDKLFKALIDHCEPSVIIDTKNGLQPLWKLKNSNISDEYQARYLNVEKGIIDWSTNHGSAGDDVHDTTRILRMPNYYHNKGDPYMCTMIHHSDKEYELKELEEKFPFCETPKPEYIPTKDRVWEDDEFDRLDIRRVFSDAMCEINKTVEYEYNGQIRINRRLTGNFHKPAWGNYIASASGTEPYRGGVVAIVKQVMGFQSREAREWIKEKYGIKKKQIEQEAVKIEPKKLSVKPARYYSWGTDALTRAFAPIQLNTSGVIAGEYESGKTAFMFHMAIANVLRGHKVLYFTLEMSAEEMYERLAMTKAGITIAEYNGQDPTPPEKTSIYEKSLEKLKSIKNLTILDPFGEDVDLSWGVLKQKILSMPRHDIIFLDNFDCINRNPRLSENAADAEKSKAIRLFAGSYMAPIITAHHLRKKPTGYSKTAERGGEDIRGTDKIKDDSDKVVIISRDKDPFSDKKNETYLRMIKGRTFPGAFKMVFFRDGDFVDRLNIGEISTWDQIQ